MKIYCDFCGSQIETTENRTCPHCGGYYSADEELLKERERVRQLNELEMKKQQLDIERMELENKGLNMFNINDSKLVNRGAKGCLAGVIVGLSILGLFFIIMMICVFADPSSEEKETKNRAETAVPHTSITYSVSLDPIKIPDIPDIEIPEITVPEIDVTDINVR